jgi:hypothetical protein
MAGLGSVYALGYRYFNAFLFWFPGMARDRPYRKVAREIRTVLARHPGARVQLSPIASARISSPAAPRKSRRQTAPLDLVRRHH